MKPGIKKLWVAALRSGKYKQCRGMLTDGEGYCCLGVLYDIAIDGWWEVYEDGTWRTPGNPTRGTLPDAVLEFTGLSKCNHDRLAWMNDDDRISFARIADWIDWNL